VADLAHEPETGTGHVRAGLGRRVVAEGIGTAFLLLAVVGSGIMATNLTDDVGVQLLANAGATAGALLALILVFGELSGAHFNPVVTLVDRAFGSLDNTEAGAYVVAQIVGACLGTIVANVIFELPAVELSTRARSSGGLWLSELIATIGLLLVIQGCVRTGRDNQVAMAVAVWIGSAYWFTSSTSFANPAATIARTLTDTFAGIKPASAPMFIVMELVGAAVAFALVRLLYPSRTSEDP
jgi:glycerol uptake facilitator-like aquaporin